MAPDGAVPAGPWDVVVFVDVLYLLPADEQRRLLAEAVRAAGSRRTRRRQGDGHPAAVEGALEHRSRRPLSVKVLRITEGSSFDFVDPAKMAGWLRDLGLLTTTRRLDRRRLHPHHLLIGRRPR